MRRGSGRLGAVAVTLLLVAGCGGSSAPSDAVPALGTSLERVDDAIVEGRYDDARSELDELVTTTTTARDDGDLERSEADRILAAAAQVMSALPAEPAEEPAPSDEPAPTETETETEAPPSPTPEESSSEDSGSEDEAEEDEKEQEKLEKEQEKLEEELQKEEEKEQEEGSDNGNGSENGKSD